jgi:hypothetical protein
MSLSHNFWELAEGCTTFGETIHLCSKFLLERSQIRMPLLLSRSHITSMLGQRRVFVRISNSCAMRLGAIPESRGCWLQSPTFDILNTCRPERFCTSLALAGFVASCSFLVKEQRKRNAFDSSQVQNRCGPRFQIGNRSALFYAQAHISTQPASPLKDAWLSLTYEDQVGSSRAEPSSCRWPQARLSQRRLPRLSRSRRFVSAGAGFRAHQYSGRDPISLR